MSNTLRLSLTLRLVTPLSSGAAGVGTVLADKAVVRNGLGEFILPGSQLRGVARHACERVARALGKPVCDSPRAERMCPQNPAIPSSVADQWNGSVRRCCVCAVFGSPYFTSRIQFHDLLAANPYRQSDGQPYREAAEAQLGTETLRAMVSLNRRRHVAEGERLFVVETTPNHSAMIFSNRDAVTGYVESEPQVLLLLAGVNTLFAVGGGRSRGLGWVEIVQAEAMVDEERIEAGDWERLREL